MIYLFLAIFAAANSHLADKVFLKPYPETPLLNEVIAFVPGEDHKFNLKSKNNCGNGTLVSETESLIECQMGAPGTSQLEFYVCDKQNTYCRREQIKIVTQSPKGLIGWINYYKKMFFSPNIWSSPQRTDISQVPPLKGFIQNDLKAGIAQAQKEKRKLLVYFTQISCGPCRLLKETSLVSDEFQQKTSDYVRVQVDIDLDIEPERLKPLQILSTPTVVIFDSDFKELGRKTSLFSPQNFAQWLTTLPHEKENDDKPWDENFKYEGKTCSDEGFRSYLYGLKRQVESETISTSERSRHLAKMDQILTYLQKSDGEDTLQCAYEKMSILGLKKYVLKNLGDSQDVKLQEERMMAILNAFPLLPGVQSAPELNSLRSELQGKETRKKFIAEAKQKNKEDYSYDLAEAGQAFHDKNYNEALIAIDKSLVLAKDRAWQKAFLFKLNILKELKREKEALQLIDEVLSQLVLPSSSAPKVHKFVQSLRSQQIKLKTNPT